MGSSHGKFSTIRNESGESEEKEEILNTRRQKSNPRLSRGVQRGTEVELVAAGWPNWLVAVAGEAINGWLPRRADTFEKIDKIGRGTYSNVYKARDVLLNKVVAMKKVRFDNLDPGSVKFMAREIIILRRLGDHPNIIKLEGLVTSKMSCSLYLVFDCMEYDLKGIQEQKGVKFSEPEIKCYMFQLLKGLDYCHNRGILHRDVTTSNLLVDKDGILKIADFGLSTYFDPEQSMPLTSNIVTLWYRPPELLLGSNSYGVGVDLWSVGCVLGELYTGKPIMPGKTEVEQLYKIFELCGSPSDDFWQNSKLPNASIFKPIEPYRRNLQATFHDLPADAVELMDTLLLIKSEYRGTAALALQSEFFTTEPLACDPSRLPKCPPRKEIDGKFQDSKMREIKGSRDRKYARDRSLRATPAPRLKKETIAKGNEHDSKGKKDDSLGPSTSNSYEITANDKVSTPLPAKSTNMQVLSREHEARILKDAQCVISYTETMIEDKGDSKEEKHLHIGPLPTFVESTLFDFLEHNQSFDPLPAAPKPMDVDRLLREHDRQIQESVERTKQQKKLPKARI